MKPTHARRALTLWHLVADEPVRSEAVDALVLRAGGARAWESSMPAEGPVLIPVVERDGVDGVIAALVIPWGRGAAAWNEPAVNGVRVLAGMHLVRHADRIEVGDDVFWVAAASVPREERYDPSVHGEDLFCFRTKARFAPGDPLVVCPGAPDKACGMMVAKRAWDIGLACHGCGWDPSAPEWQPPRWARARQVSAADRLLELARAQTRRQEVLA